MVSNVLVSFCVLAMCLLESFFLTQFDFFFFFFRPQTDIIGSGGIPALVQLLDEGSPEAQAHSAEVLVTLAAADDNRKRLVTRWVCAVVLLLRIA